LEKKRKKKENMLPGFVDSDIAIFRSASTGIRSYFYNVFQFIG
jgi:hypothetical protein